LDKLRAGDENLDLIILDIVMPDMTGLEILKEMREQKLAEKIPIVMLTNQSDERDISEAEKLGVVDYIIKSSKTPSEVVKEVMQILKK